MAESHINNEKLIFGQEKDCVRVKEGEGLLKEKCRLCLSFRPTFYCEKCLANGHFTSTTDKEQGKLLFLTLYVEIVIVGTVIFLEFGQITGLCFSDVCYEK